MSVATGKAFDAMFEHLTDSMAKLRAAEESGAPRDEISFAWEDVMVAYNSSGQALALHVTDEQIFADRFERGEVVFSDLVMTTSQEGKPRVFFPVPEGQGGRAPTVPALACSAKPAPSPAPEIPAPTDDGGYGDRKIRQFFNLPVWSNE